MAMSEGLRNRLVGITIIVTTILILLPILLSKDMIKRVDREAIAINENGAVVDNSGNLTMQDTANLGQSLGFQELPSLNQNIPSRNQGHNAQFNNGLNNNNPPQSVNINQGFNQEKNQSAPSIASEELVAKRPQAKPNQAVSNAQSSQEEILTVAKPKPVANSNTPAKTQNTAPKPSEPKEEILTVAKPKPAVASTPTTSNNSQNAGSKVFVGQKPNTKYVIQVGVFSKKDNANNVVNKIKSVGISVYGVEVNSNGRVLFRVFAGGANSKDELNAKLQQIDKLCGTKGKVVPL